MGDPEPSEDDQIARAVIFVMGALEMASKALPR